jgi:hypothetical protein
MRSMTVLAVASALVGCQPEDETPGFWLAGETVEDRIDDWGFTNDIEEIFVETRPWYFVPHSTTIWCVEVDGELFIGSYGDEKKTWENNIESNPEARLSIGGKLYEVNLMPVTELGRVETLDRAYGQKYDMVDVFGEDVPDWWYYRITPRP